MVDDPVSTSGKNRGVRAAPILSYSTVTGSAPVRRIPADWPRIIVLVAIAGTTAVTAALVATGAAIAHFQSVEGSRQLYGGPSWERYQILGFTAKFAVCLLALLGVALGAGIRLRRMRAPWAAYVWLLLIIACIVATLLVGLDLLSSPLWP